MAIITKVKIQNFQSHEDTTIDLDRGLNIITGPSDNGKSAIIRAIKWVLFNEPRGTEFIRQGTAAAKVTIEMDNGNTIIRERSSSKNRYTVLYPEKDPITFEGFGNEIPQEVIGAHGITKAYLDSSLSSSLNIAEQLEGPFLLSETGSVRAKAIGRLIGLHIIDRAIKNSNVDLRRENQSKDRVSSELKEVESTLKEYEYLKEVEVNLEKSGQIIEKLSEVLTRKKRLEVNLKNIISIENDYTAQSAIVKSLNKLERYELCIKSIEIINEKLYKLKRVFKTLNEIDIEINSAFFIIRNTERINECTGLLENITTKTGVMDKAKSLKAAFAKVERSEGEAKWHLYATVNVKPMEDKLKKLDINISKLESIRGLNVEIKRLNKEQEKYSEILQSAANIDKLSSIHNLIQEKIEKLVKVKKSAEKLKDVSNKIVDGEKYIISNKIETDKLLKDYSSVLRNAGKCPVCRSNIGNDILNEIIKSYSN
ncbi:MAG TPA: AAA family ATPase [Pseudobacteroides sp.]|uniref:AAA family ATPase n=1 Tax=Pseudobacteroides sp. TaxID=1968840 RepID=UPI002F9418E2